MMKYKHKFYTLLMQEALISPVLYGKNILKYNLTHHFTQYPCNKHHNRTEIKDPTIYVCIHEWGGYTEKREKKINKVKPFECGLYYQLQRFENYKGDRKLDITLTMSDSNLWKGSLPNHKIVNVPNTGMDFSGYSTFLNSLKDKKNAYVILTNSSVNCLQEDFLDGYIDFMDKNPNVGILGTSFATRIVQSLILNNFTPHIQTFFLVTTLDVLREVKEKNKGVFPGEGIDYKRLLIRIGEIGLSNTIMKLGYDLACVPENGIPFIFDKSCLIDNGRKTWKMPHGDYRLFTNTPNRINPILKTSLE